MSGNPEDTRAQQGVAQRQTQPKGEPKNQFLSLVHASILHTNGHFQLLQWATKPGKAAFDPSCDWALLSLFWTHWHSGSITRFPEEGEGEKPYCYSITDSKGRVLLQAHSTLHYKSKIMT